VGTVSVFPATAILERLGKVPVVERYQRRDAAFEQPVHEPVIEVHTAAIEAATALGGTRGQATEKR
jgi:hypothetical protein